MAKKGYPTEVERKKQLESQGYNVVRCSGSIGCQDLIAAKVSKFYPRLCFELFYEQVKKTRKKTFYFDERSKDELRRLKEITSKFYIPCYFSIKFVNKGWKIIDVNEINGNPIKFMEEKNVNI